jgi:hypothetical protein
MMAQTSDAATPGLLRLPSGRLVRGRGLRRPLPEGALPEFGVYLLSDQPASMQWDTRWVRWPDFRLPADRDDAQDAMQEAWGRSETERVEVACGGGRGRTGTALACLAVLDGVPARSGDLRAKALRRQGRRNALAAALRRPLPHLLARVAHGDPATGAGLSQNRNPERNGLQSECSDSPEVVWGSSRSEPVVLDHRHCFGEVVS